MLNNFDNLDYQCWNLDISLAEHIFPRLLYFKVQGLHLIPYEFITYDSDGYQVEEYEDEWQETFDEIVFAFGEIAQGRHLNVIADKESRNRYINKVQRGLNNFAKYYMSFWN